MVDENPYTGVGKMNLCNYLSNVSSLGGLAGEQLRLLTTEHQESLWLISLQKNKRTIWIVLEKSLEFKITDLTFYNMFLKNVENLRYYYYIFSGQYIMNIIFLREKIS